MTNHIVVKIGGSLLFTETGEIHTERLSQYSNVLTTLRKEGMKLCVVVGGGKVARNYIKVLHTFHTPEALCDMMGIRVSQINALLLIAALGNVAYPYPPENLHELANALTTDRVVVMGGLQPGQSTNACLLYTSPSPRD